MMNDTVREELQTKITPITQSANIKRPVAESLVSIPIKQTFSAPPVQPAVKTAPTPVQTSPVPAPVLRKPETTELVSQKTSPTLVGFQTKNATMPDWRLQLQNAVKQRRGTRTDAISTVSAAPPQYASVGSAALKSESVPAPAIEIDPNLDPRVANAMRRIAESQKTFSGEKPKLQRQASPAPAQPKSFPFNVVTPQHEVSAPAPPKPATVNPPPKPVLVSRPEILEKKKFDTNKLPQLPIPAIKVEKITTGDLPINKPSAPLPEFSPINRIRIKVEDPVVEDVEQAEIWEDEIEDLAPFSMRFNAGLFDLIIGGFVSALLLSPLVFTGSDWFSTAGLLTFGGTWAIVLFLYMTLSVGFVGKTLGMRLFSLEIVDAVENEYPSLHQAAVNSSVYIISMLLGGVGFLTVFFNEEKRAIHDLLSGTIIVKEF